MSPWQSRLGRDSYAWGSQVPAAETLLTPPSTRNQQGLLPQALVPQCWAQHGWKTNGKIIYSEKTSQSKCPETQQGRNSLAEL